MLARRILENITWIDLESPTQAEVRGLVKEFGIAAAVAEELLLPTVRPRVELYDDYMYAILYFPSLRHARGTHEQELDFVVGKNFIITTRYDSIDPLHKFAKVFDVSTLIDSETTDMHGGHIFYFLLRKMYKSIEQEINVVHDALRDIEKHIFRGQERDMVVSLSHAGRVLLDLRQVLEPHRDILRDIEARAPALFGNQFTHFLRNISNEYYRVHNHIMRQVESLHELRETNNSLLTTKQNDVIQRLTVMAFLTFPLALIAAVFGMNVEYPFLASNPHSFWVVLSLMVAVAIMMFAYFKRKGWL
ncbi:MAG: magnesium transporter CorA family protein [Parcubacteria group bacterium]|nr:magnesium transporter CorA family protein [Parcubacteria group bacterium]